MEELSLHILDLAQNSLAANASLVSIRVEEDTRSDILKITVLDNGHGMDANTLSRAFDPFFSTKGKKIGLGLSLFRELARQCGGECTLISQPMAGCCVTAWFVRSHLDLPPLGDMAQTIYCLLVCYPFADIDYRHSLDERQISFDTRKICPYPGKKMLSQMMCDLSRQESMLYGGANCP